MKLSNRKSLCLWMTAAMVLLCSLTVLAQAPAPGQAAPCRWSITAVQPDDPEHPRSVVDLRGLVKRGQLQHLRLPGEPAGPKW